MKQRIGRKMRRICRLGICTYAIGSVPLWMYDCLPIDGVDAKNRQNSFNNGGRIFQYLAGGMRMGDNPVPALFKHHTKMETSNGNSR